MAYIFAIEVYSISVQESKYLHRYALCHIAFKTFVSLTIAHSYGFRIPQFKVIRRKIIVLIDFLQWPCNGYTFRKYWVLNNVHDTVSFTRRTDDIVLVQRPNRMCKAQLTSFSQIMFTESQTLRMLDLKDSRPHLVTFLFILFKKRVRSLENYY